MGERIQTVIVATDMINPNDPDHYLSLANALQKKGDLNLAITSLKKSLEIDSSLKASQYNLAVLLMRVNRYEEALSECQLIDTRNFSAYQKVAVLCSQYICLLRLESSSAA